MSPAPLNLLDETPVVAILRGLQVVEAAEVGRALHRGGVRVMEVPLNGPGALDALVALIAAMADAPVVVGAGTVLTVDQVDAVASAGGQLIVSPCCNPTVIRATRARGLLSMPGVATPTEAYTALDAGADLLKLFPGEQMPPPVLRAWRAVFPASVRLYPVGGVRPDNIGAWLDAGASGFGLGTALYRPGMAADEVERRAAAIVGVVRRGR